MRPCALPTSVSGLLIGVFGAYLLGIYDPDTETYQTISKLGTGFSEEQLQQLADSMRPHIIPQPRNYYRWVLPLWQVKHSARLGTAAAACVIGSMSARRLLRRQHVLYVCGLCKGYQ